MGVTAMGRGPLAPPPRRGQREVPSERIVVGGMRRPPFASVPYADTTDGKLYVSTEITNSISVIDPATNKVVGKIEGIEVNHGAAVFAG